MTPVLGLVVLGCFAAVFTAGVLTGRTIAAQRHVDRLMRRELRFRDAAVPSIPVSPGSPLDVALREAVVKHPSVYVAGGTKLGLTTPREATAGAEAFSGALRAARRPRTLDDATQQLVDQARGNGKCGAPITTSLGPMPCLRPTAHGGLCG